MPSFEILSEYMTAGEAARRLGVSSSRFHRIVAALDLYRLDTPLGSLFHPDEVERVRNQRKEESK